MRRLHVRSPCSRTGYCPRRAGQLASVVQQLQDLSRETSRLRHLGRLGTSFDHHSSYSREAELTREHEAGRPSTHNDNICKHERSPRLSRHRPIAPEPAGVRPALSVTCLQRAETVSLVLLVRGVRARLACSSHRGSRGPGASRGGAFASTSHRIRSASYPSAVVGWWWRSSAVINESTPVRIMGLDGLRTLMCIVVGLSSLLSTGSVGAAAFQHGPGPDASLAFRSRCSASWSAISARHSTATESRRSTRAARMCRRTPVWCAGTPIRRARSSANSSSTTSSDGT